MRRARLQLIVDYGRRYTDVRVARIYAGTSEETTVIIGKPLWP